MRKRKSQRAPKNETGSVFSSSHTTPGLSFAAVLCSDTQQEQQPQLPLVEEACITTVGEMCASLPWAWNQQVPSKSVQASNANSSSMNDI
jgi:hypothetical protein